MDGSVEAIVRDFSERGEVEAVALGGSRAGTECDDTSDYDLYIYINIEIPVSVRRDILSPHCSNLELDNKYWETGDEGLLKDSEIGIDIMYRTLTWMDSHLHGLLIENRAQTGYSTCLWHNFKTSRLLFDRDGKAAGLQKNFDIPFPLPLKKAIVVKNYPLMNDALCSYPRQIEKALKRGDAVSVNHRLAAFLASYFDIMFALNGMSHPGEKRILAALESGAGFIPENMAADVASVLVLGGKMDKHLMDGLHTLSASLEVVLRKTGLWDKYSPTQNDSAKFHKIS